MTEEHLSTAERRRILVQRMQTEGAEAAYEAALAIVRDPKAAAPARATSLVAILRAGGYFNARADDTPGKPASEMTYDELQQSIEDIRRQTKGADGKTVFD